MHWPSPVPIFMNFSAARSLSASAFLRAISDSGFCGRSNQGEVQQATMHRNGLHCTRTSSNAQALWLLIPRHPIRSEQRAATAGLQHLFVHHIGLNGCSPALRRIPHNTSLPSVPSLSAGVHKSLQIWVEAMARRMLKQAEGVAHDKQTSPDRHSLRHALCLGEHIRVESLQHCAACNEQLKALERASSAAGQSSSGRDMPGGSKFDDKVSECVMLQPA